MEFNNEKIYGCILIRIYKVLSYYEDYWALMKQYGEQTERTSNFISLEETKRLEKAKRWRENYLVKEMLCFILFPLSVFSIIAYLVPYIYTIVPVYQSDTCWASFLTSPATEVSKYGMTIDSIPCGLRLTNAMMFVVLNWAEIVGLAILFWLVRNIKNELNIKREVQAVLFFWGFFSIIYFSLVIDLQKTGKENVGKIQNIRLGIFLAIQARNVSTLFATTMFSIYTLVRHPEKAYPKTIEGKLEALDFDLMLTSPLSFQKFYDFIETNSSYNKPYLEMYVLSKLYQEQVDRLMNEFNDPNFQRECDDLEQLKEKILQIAIKNQGTHFNFENLVKRTLARQSSQDLNFGASPRFNFLGGVNESAGSQIIQTQGGDQFRISGSSESLDIKCLLPTFQFKPANSQHQVNYIDFTLCINKSKHQLRNVYDLEFKKHPKFLELIGELFKNEIEHKFLEQAEVIKDTSNVDEE